jgi:hypothetical protein
LICGREAALGASIKADLTHGIAECLYDSA